MNAVRCTSWRTAAHVYSNTYSIGMSIAMQVPSYARIIIARSAANGSMQTFVHISKRCITTTDSYSSISVQTIDNRYAFHLVVRIIMCVCFKVIDCVRKHYPSMLDKCVETFDRWEMEGKQTTVGARDASPQSSSPTDATTATDDDDSDYISATPKRRTSSLIRFDVCV